MSWGPTFIAAIESDNRAPTISAALIQTPGGANVGGQIEISSEGILSVSGGSSTLTPGSWSSTLGAFVLRLTPEAGSTLRVLIKRGSILEVHVAFPGTQGNRVMLGKVVDVDNRPGGMRIECYDLVSALYNRLDNTDAEKLSLFSDVGASTTLSGNYTAGSGTMSVADTSAFQKSAKAPTRGLLLVTPTTGDPFYLKWSASTASIFTVVTSGASFGTTDVDAVIGDTITHVGYLRGHPLDLVRQVLVSTGAAAAGTSDILPAEWGFGLDVDWLDVNDTIAWRDSVLASSTLASGTYEWEIKIEAPQLGITWLTSLLNAAGLFLATRQGSLTVHCAQNLYNAQIETGITITDDDISEVLSYRLFDRAVPVEYNGTLLTAGDGATQDDTTTGNATAIGTFPGAYQAAHSLAGVWQNVAPILQRHRELLRPWATTVPERLQLRCRGWRLAQLSVGDVVRVTSATLQGRLEAAGATLTDRPAMVVRVAPAWDRDGVDLDLSLPPQQTDPDHG